jgi:hypothetical protein
METTMKTTLLLGTAAGIKTRLLRPWALRKAREDYLRWRAWGLAAKTFEERYLAPAPPATAPIGSRSQRRDSYEC